MNFSYKAYYGSGQVELGKVEAADDADAARILAEKGRMPFELKPATRPGFRRRREIATLKGAGRLSQSRLFLDLAILTEAGMTLPQALRALLTSEAVPAQRTAIATIAAHMNSGGSAASSFALLEEVSSETAALLASGERASQMSVVLRALATQMGDRDRRVAEFRNALAYPAFLLVMMCLALGVIVFVLVPTLAPVFENSGRQPPTIIRVLKGLHDAAFDPIIQVLALGLLTLASSFTLVRIRTVAGPPIRRWILALPFIGGAIHKANCARYLSSLSLLIGGGTPMTEALALAASCNPSPQLRLALTMVRDQVAAGDRLPTALERTRQFEPKIISLLSVGDEVNRLTIVLSRASEILDEEAKTIMSRLLSALTPAMTIVLGLLIGGLVVSVMTALLSINDLALQG